MRVGIHTGLTDLDQLAERCRQMDVDDVIMGIGTFAEFRKQEYVTSASVAALKDEMAQRGIRLAGITPPSPSPEAVLGDNENEVENLCKIIRALGEADVEMMHFYPLDRFKNYKEEYHHEKPPLEVMPGEEKWEIVIGFFRRLADMAEEADVKISNHVFAADIMLEILDTVGSPNLGVTYCTGTYIFGYDPYTTINLFGIERIFICHARNLVRHSPGRQGHEEVPLESGDIDMARYIRILTELGYDGLIVPEHWGKTGDLSSSVAYLRKLINQSQPRP